MPRSVAKTSDDELLNMMRKRWEHSRKVTESGWNVARHGVKGLSTATAQRAAQFALRQEIDMLSQASEGYRTAETNALSALAEIEQMPYRIHNATSFVSRLPDELMEIVFTMGLDDLTVNDETETRPSACLQYALDISRVSHVWRRIAVSTPPLWAFVIYNYPLVAEDFPDPDLECTRLNLERSRSEYLSVSVTFEPRHIGQLKRLMRLLQPHLSRCRRIELNLSNYTVSHVLPLSGPLHALRSLDVCVSDFSRNISEQPDVPLRLVDDGPSCQLDSLDLAGPYPFKRSHLNPSQLLRLRYIASGISHSAVSRFAAHFPFLRSLEITMMSPQLSHQDTYILPSVRRLSIVNLEAFAILRRLEGPSLRHLQLWIQPDTELDSSPLPRDAFSSSPQTPLAFPTLRTFSLTSFTFDSDLAAAGMLANYIGAHTLLQGLQFCGDVLGLDTLMMLAALVVDRTRAGDSSLRLIRVALLPPREGEVAGPPSTNMHAEIAELLLVFIRCVPGLRLQVQVQKGEAVAKPFAELRASYPRQVECAETFEKSVPDTLDALEKWEG